jgi:hypothetical protein
MEGAPGKAQGTEDGFDSPEGSVYSGRALGYSSESFKESRYFQAVFPGVSPEHCIAFQRISIIDRSKNFNNTVYSTYGAQVPEL